VLVDENGRPQRLSSALPEKARRLMMPG